MMIIVNGSRRKRRGRKADNVNYRGGLRMDILKLYGNSEALFRSISDKRICIIKMIRYSDNKKFVELLVNGVAKWYEIAHLVNEFSFLDTISKIDY